MNAKCDPANRPSYADLAAAWQGLATRLDLRLSEVPCERTERSLLLAESSTGGPFISLAAGVHGDEPAGPWAALSAARDGLLHERFGYRIWPCTNPSGYARGTRVNAEGADVNRSFTAPGMTPEAQAICAANGARRFALSIDVHEDPEAEGFYCYAGGEEAERIGRAIVAAIDEAGFPIQDFAAFDFGEPGAGNPNRRLSRGLVIMGRGDEARFFAGLSLNLMMLAEGAEHVVTLESPRSRPWKERIAIHRVAITAAIEALG